MLTPEVERLPPVTIEFLRVVCGVEAVQITSVKVVENFWVLTAAL